MKTACKTYRVELTDAELSLAKDALRMMRDYSRAQRRIEGENNPRLADRWDKLIILSLGIDSKLTDSSEV